MVPLIKSISNAYGISIIILLMGYGIVAVPKSYWRGGDHQLMMKYYQF